MIGRIATRHSFCLVLILLASLGEIRSQAISISKDEYLNQYSTPVLLVRRQISEADPAALQALALKDGENETWDFSAFKTTPLDSAVYERVELTAPEVDLATFPSANHVVKVYSPIKNSPDPILFNYYNVTDQGVSQLGVILFQDTDPQSPGREKTVQVNDSPTVLGVFPLQAGATYVSSHKVGSATITSSAVVQGWGELILTEASGKALRVWTEVSQSGSSALTYVATFVTESGFSVVINLDKDKSNAVGTVQLARTYTPTPSERNDMPGLTTFSPNYPNPFNKSTRIPVTLEKPGQVSLKIYNVIGQEVEEVADGYFPAGEHVFVWDAGSQASGQYMCRLEIDGHLAGTRMLSVVR